MKGVILGCVREIVLSRFGKDVWTNILDRSVLNGSASFLSGANVDDEKFFNLLECCCNELNIGQNEFLEIFAAYWVNVFGIKTYGTFYSASSTAKGFIKNLDYVHEVMTRTIPDSSPPRFDLDWKSDTEVVVTYKSHRGLVSLAAMCLREVGVLYKTKLKVNHDGKSKITVIFPD